MTDVERDDSAKSRTVVTSTVITAGNSASPRHRRVKTAPETTELDRKTKPRYNGPFRVLRRTNEGSYVLEEMDGTVSRRGIAGFRLLPYLSRDSEIKELLGEPDELSGEENTEEISDDGS